MDPSAYGNCQFDAVANQLQRIGIRRTCQQSYLSLIMLWWYVKKGKYIWCPPHFGSSLQRVQLSVPCNKYTGWPVQHSRVGCWRIWPRCPIAYFRIISGWREEWTLPPSFSAWKYYSIDCSHLAIFNLPVYEHFFQKSVTSCWSPTRLYQTIYTTDCSQGDDCSQTREVFR